MKKNRTTGLLSEHYLHYLLQEAAWSDRQMIKLARRLDNLEKHCSENPVEQLEEMDRIKKRMYSIGISYYATRADYCYRRAKMEFRKQKKQSM